MPDAAGLPSDCSVRWLDPARPANGGGPMPTVVIDFRTASFSPDWFDRHGIACPGVIANSVGKRQAEFFFGRCAARLALASLGVASTAIPIGAGREPVWPPGVTGSISHADDIAVACACRPEAAQAVGIDVERIPPAKVLADIARLTTSPAEQATLDRLAAAHPELRPGLLPTLLFSAKESVYKALVATVGRNLDFKDLVLTRLDPLSREIHLEASRTLARGWVRGQSMRGFYELLDEAVVLTSFGWRPQPHTGARSTKVVQ